MIRVLLVDDHRLIRASLRRIVDEAGDMQVVDEAVNGEEAIRKARECAPDIVLMDINMPGVGGLEATSRICGGFDARKVIIISAYTDDPYPLRLMQAGASGYITKDCEPTEVVDAIRAVAKGETWLAVDIARQLAKTALSGQGTESPLRGLSQRELQVLMMVAQGIANLDIASALKLSPKTVATYRYRLYEKLDVQNDVELARLAMRHGIQVEPRIDG